MPAWPFNREWLSVGVRALVALLLCTGALGCGNEASAPQGEPSSPQAAVVSDSMTIPRMLEADDRFSTLRASLDSTGLDSLLSTDGPFTLFAPPDDAFSALPPSTIETLLSEETDRLRTILSKHVVEGRVVTDEWSPSQTVIALSGDTLSLRRQQEGVEVETASLIEGDIKAANGLIHVIDEVLPPPVQPNMP